MRRLRVPNRTVNLDTYPNCFYAVWASTPAVLWTGDRPQEFGIHVHVYDGANRIIDQTFGEVLLNGKALNRDELLKAMIGRTVI
jgi:hypothetical protein